MTVLNWEKYNPRKDYKRPWWFALSNRLMENSDFYSFTDGEFRAWIYILSQASQHRSNQVRITFAHAGRVCNVRERFLKSAISKLNKIGVIEILKEDIRTDHVRETNATLQNITLQNITIHNRADRFDFDLVYEKYPRKEGKLRGIQICKKTITTPEDYTALGCAVDRYRAVCKEKGTELKFIKQFSTFMASWREWLDPETGTGESFAKPSGIDWSKIKLEAKP